MNCPVDGSTLSITDRQGIEIDFCPQCRGIWLDRGELDKLIERTAEWEPRGGRDRRDDDRHDRDRDDDRRGHRGKKRKGLLGELFEFGE